MTRLLHAPTLDGAPARLAPPAPVLDDATRTLIAEAEERAYARGVSEGRQQAEAAHTRAAEQAGTAVSQALRTAQEAIADVQEAYGTRVLDLARQIATAVLGAEPHDDGAALLARIREALAALDHGPFTVRLAPDDHALVTAADTELPAGAEVAVDERLRPGEARIDGPWSGADLTRDVVVRMVADVLDTPSARVPAGLDVHRAPGGGA